MISKIIVTNREAAKGMSFPDAWAAISISTRLGEHPELQTENRVGLLRLTFADACQELDPLVYSEEFRQNTVYFDDGIADQILMFAATINQQASTVLVHCEAGISRSSAVAAILHTIYIPETVNNYFDKPYSPNSLVYSRLLERAVDLGQITIEHFRGKQ